LDHCVVLSGYLQGESYLHMNLEVKIQGVHSKM